MPTPKLVATAVLLALALSGCASFNHLDSDVATYGSWSAERRPGSFAFDRLPSEENPPSAHRQQLETSARAALEARGFRAAGAPTDAEYLVQVGARVVSDDPWMYNAPLFWRGAWSSYGWGYPYRRFGAWYGGGWGRGWGPGWGPDLSSFDREVVLVIRDRSSGSVLYEARADNTGPSPDIDYLLPAMFDAALKDFPRIDPKPRKVQTVITRG